MIDLDDYSTVNLKWLGQSIKDAYAKHAKSDQLLKLRVIVMMSTPTKEITDACSQAEIQFSTKPKTLADLKLILADSSN